MTKIIKFEHEVLQKICDILGDTDTGLTGSEIGQLLNNSRIDDPAPGFTKRYRLFEALSKRQESDSCANNIVAFIQSAMNPVRYVDSQKSFELRRDRLNKALAFAGFTLGEDGKLHYTDVVHTLSEAEQRANHLRKQLSDRNVHTDVLRFCRAELLQDNYFHAVFEATKSVADKIRQKSGLKSDGSQLVDEAFSFAQSRYPRLAFNSLQTDTERSEHKGLMNMMKGLFGTFRNVTAHASKIKWRIDEQDALDMLSLTSLIHRRLDEAVPTRNP